MPALSSSLPTTLQSKKHKIKRNNKAERNTTNVLASDIEGNRGNDNIEALLAFIENTETSKKTNIINVNKNVINSKKNKNTSSNSKKENSKLKKCTSLEELKSSSKMEEEEAIAQSESEKVSLRQKKRNNSGNDVKETKSTSSSSSSSNQMPHAANKRGERRSWGTEELNYLGERDADGEKELKKSKENPKPTKTGKQNKIETSTMKQASIESIPTTFEAAEFHVVTKKKKTKKRQMMEEQQHMHQQQHQHGNHQSYGSGNRNVSNNNGHSGTHHSRNYQQSSNYNDRDIYLNSLTTKENRRKSTSSMPPSDKSDTSDVDSIRSLPIESAASRISYADIARTAATSVEKTPTSATGTVDPWPAVSASTKLHTDQHPDTPIIISDDSCKLTPSTPRCNDDKSPTLAHIVSEKSPTTPSIASIVSGATPKHSDIIKSPTTVSASVSVAATIIPTSPSVPTETSKMQLQKSKSVDSDKYTTMNLDQFPGLEKTIKPQKSHQNLPVSTTIQTSSNALPQTPTMSQLLKSQILSPNLLLATNKNPSKKNATNIENGKDKHCDENDVKAIESNVNVDEIMVNSSVTVECNSTSTTGAMKKSKKVNNHQLNAGNCNSDNVNHQQKNQIINRNGNINSNATNSNNNNTNNGSHRPAVIIFNDNDVINENVSPLQFGDFNDDILQLMKQDDQVFQTISSTDVSNASSVSDCNCILNSTTIDDNEKSQSMICNQRIITSPKFDPGSSPIHNRSTQSTESNKLSAANVAAIDSMSSSSKVKKNALNKKISINHNLNNINCNSNINKTSDVVSNQSICELSDIEKTITNSVQQLNAMNECNINANDKSNEFCVNNINNNNNTDNNCNLFETVKTKNQLNIGANDIDCNKSNEQQLSMTPATTTRTKITANASVNNNVNCVDRHTSNDIETMAESIVCGKGVNVRYIDPPVKMDNCHLETIVNFVGLGKRKNF